MGEQLARDYLRRKGYVILECNFQARVCTSGAQHRVNRPGRIIAELDIVAKCDNVLVFVEVRTRLSARCGTPAQSITPRKIAKLRSAVQFYLKQHPSYVGYPVRLDAVCIARVDGDIAVQHFQGIG